MKGQKTVFVLLSFYMMFYLLQPFQVKAQANEVPIRNVFESMGYKVGRQGKDIKLTRENDVIRLTPNSKYAVKNGRTLSLSKKIRFNKKKKRYMIGVLDVYRLAKEDKKEKHYRVRKGDSLSVIAKKYKVTVNQLREWNNLSTDVITPGQHLHTKSPYYTVRQGDSIWEIAHKTESSVEDIKFYNNLTLDVVFPGQRLVLPTQPSVKPPHSFQDGVFPLAQETYEPYMSTFGENRSFSTKGAKRSHEGVDIMTPKWVPVFSATEGTVIRYGWNTYGGYRITIKGKNGVTFYYAHFMAYPPGLKKGQRVSKGQLIGYTGNTGYGKEGTMGKFPPHLHFGMYAADGRAIDPYPYLKWWEMRP